MEGPRYDAGTSARRRITLDERVSRSTFFSLTTPSRRPEAVLSIVALCCSLRDDGKSLADVSPSHHGVPYRGFLLAVKMAGGWWVRRRMDDRTAWLHPHAALPRWATGSAGTAVVATGLHAA